MRLPDFIVGGTIKGGTTSLNYYLRQHPQIFMSPFKEPRYFAFDPTDAGHVNGDGLKFPIRTLEEYGALFDDARPDQIAGETSPHYLISPVAPGRIRQTIPTAKLVFSLRQPVRRAHSAYWYSVSLGQESRPIEEALTDRDYYVTFGRYYDYLAAWYRLFDASRIRVILFEDLVREPVTVYQDLCRFLGVDDTVVPDTTVRNKGGVAKNQQLRRFYDLAKNNPAYRAIAPHLPTQLRSALVETRNKNQASAPPLPQPIAERLQRYYDDDIRKLEDLLGRDLGNWR